MRIFAVVVALVLVTSVAQGGVAVKFDLDNSLSPTSVASQLTATDFDYTSSWGGTHQFVLRSGSDYCQEATGFPLDAGVSCPFFFSVTVDSGYQLNVSSIEFDARYLTDGPPMVHAYYDPGNFNDTYMDTAILGTDWQHFVVTQNVPSNLTGTVAFKFFGLFATTHAGAMQIDDVVLNGTVTPEPATLSLLALAGLGILARRKLK
jgi:hypothetical protein